jgi:hypothetical protein
MKPAARLTPASRLTPAALLLLAACAGSSEEPAPRTVWVAEGPPTSCITTNQIRSMRVVDDRTIDFEMTGRRVFRNDLPTRCPGLSFNTAVRHNSRTSQLCSLNTITPRAPGGGWNNPGCRLGQFQPLVRAPVPATAPAAPPATGR